MHELLVENTEGKKMEYEYSQRNLNMIKWGLMWNAISILLTAGYKGYTTYNNGGSLGDAILGSLFLIVVTGAVLGLNVYAFKFIQREKSKKAVTLALLMSIAGVLSLNLIGSLLVVFGYIRIRTQDVIKY